MNPIVLLQELERLEMELLDTTYLNTQARRLAKEYNPKTFY